MAKRNAIDKMPLTKRSVIQNKLINYRIKLP